MKTLPVDPAEARSCKTCLELPDDGTCDKCGASINSTMDAWIPKPAAPVALLTLGDVPIGAVARIAKGLESLVVHRNPEFTFYGQTGRMGNVAHVLGWQLPGETEWRTK